MKKRLAKVTGIALVAAMVIGLAACGSSNDGAANDAAGAASAAAESTDAAAGEIQLAEDGKLHMATNAAFPPYEMTTDDGGFEGIDVEVATAIAEKLGLELVVDDMDFSATIAAVQSGKSDMVMAGMTVTPERQENIDFTDSYANAIQVVIVPEDSDIQSVDDLANDKMIGCQEGTTGYIYCSDTPENGGYGEDHVLSYTNGAMAVQALLGGKVDAVVIDNEPAKAFVEANEGLRILDTEFANEDYAIGIAKGNDALMSAVNGALQELIADGTVQSIVDKYIVSE
mgnify:CR=1 FL=1